MALTVHRQSPNRVRELRERAWHLVRSRIGPGVICARCGARYATYSDACAADLDERCPGFNAIDLLMVQAEKEVGLVP